MNPGGHGFQPCRKNALQDQAVSAAGLHVFYFLGGYFSIAFLTMSSNFF
jgi:hypothetical protein